MALLKQLHGHDVDMTTGSIVRHLVLFAFPLLIGNIFQQFYNVVDAWAVGNYVSKQALSAVGSVGPIVNTLIGLFVGLASGAGAVISQYYGAKNDAKVRVAVHTSIVMTLVLGVVFTVIGLLMTPQMLRFMKVPDDVFPEAKAYLAIYFSGIVGLMLYNIGAGILRAVGDSRRPFIFLVVSAVINTALDLLFILHFKMGVRGVAYATIIAQGVSAILVMVTLMRSPSSIRVRPQWLRTDLGTLGKIVNIGIPAAFQMAITAFSNVFVQSYVNYFGTDCMSGWTAYGKIDQLTLLPMQALALASTTFVGQNLGANQEPRARRGIHITLLISVLTTALLMVPIMIFAPACVRFFNGEQGVIDCGTVLIRYISPFYVFCCVNQVFAGVLRGAGNSRAPMFIMLSSFVFFRQIYLYVMAHWISNEIIPIAMGYPAGWLVCSTIIMIYYHRTSLSKWRIVEE